MSEHRTQRLTGSEQLQRRITIANLATGAAAALWLVPIALLSYDVPHDTYVLVLVAAGTFTLSTVAAGITLRSQLRNAQWRERVEDISLRRHNELTTKIADDNAELRRLVTAQLGDVRRRVDEVAGKVGRDYFGIYADAITDMQGGPEVVNGQETRRLTGHNENNVVRLPRTGNGGGH